MCSNMIWSSSGISGLPWNHTSSRQICLQIPGPKLFGSFFRKLPRNGISWPALEWPLAALDFSGSGIADSTPTGITDGCCGVGLDSSTTLLIVNCIRNFTKALGGTVLVSLLQPEPAVYEVFDDILLLSEGKAPALT